MTNQPQTPSTTAKTPLPSSAAAAAHKTPAGQGHGDTTIADAVVAKIAGIATRNIPGVFALGGGAARALGSLRDAIGQSDVAQGISVEVGKTQAAVDVTLIVEYPHPLQEVAGAVRDAVYAAVEDLVGLEVTEVNISITDVHIPTDDTRASDVADQKDIEKRETRVS
ncbi:Asp23/Gls24 family envelope stress response protein [Paenarthrobacter sp. Z7-10]|uniref:Asp23/Gls24 family envelope stress response protein n=1 Tax=Paenarthrobacter sp. Z7-10 TaxID=2787635 RepID=UPI003FA6F055